MSGNRLKTLAPTDISPSDLLYIADRHLRIAYVNDEWRSFAQANNGARLLSEGWNPHLLANFSGSEKIRWTAIYKALLSGQMPFHEENFQCPSPIERRAYRLRITPHRDAAGMVDYLVHHTVRIDQQSRPQTALQERLKALDADPQVTVEAYRSHVMARLLRPVHFQATLYFQPLEEVGGDLLWHRNYADGSTDLVLADVMGHGLEAARLAAKMVFLLDSITETYQHVAQHVAHLNRLLLELPLSSAPTANQPLFATGLYARMSPQEQSLVICSFGHSGPIFSKVGHIFIDGGLPVGLMEQTEPWPEVTLSLASHGHRFLIFTDGVTEQFNLQGEMFGESSLEREFHQTHALPLPQMLAQLCSCIEAFRGEALVKDDRTLLGLEYTAALDVE